MPTFRAAPVRIPRTQLALTGRGLIAQVGDNSSNTQTWTSQKVFGSAVGLQAGDVVSNIVACVSTSAAGTSATLVRFGLATSGGTMLAISGNVNAASAWPLGYVPVPLSASYTVPADGLYYAVAVKDGTWGTTDAVLTRTPTGTSPSGAIGSGAKLFFEWTGQTDLPAVGGALTMSAATGWLWLGVS